MLAPAFLGVIMLIVQFALWFNARQVALAAAQAGARVAREEAATNANWRADASAAAQRDYKALDTGLLSSLSARAVTGTHGGTPVVGVTVTGPLGYSVFSWVHLTWHVSATVTGPEECFHPADEGGACG